MILIDSNKNRWEAHIEELKECTCIHRSLVSWASVFVVCTSSSFEDVPLISLLNASPAPLKFGKVKDKSHGPGLIGLQSELTATDVMKCMRSPMRQIKKFHQERESKSGKSNNRKQCSKLSHLFLPNRCIVVQQSIIFNAKKKNK
jgi:hypothetical protein